MNSHRKPDIDPKNSVKIQQELGEIDLERLQSNIDRYEYINIEKRVLRALVRVYRAYYDAFHEGE